MLDLLRSFALEKDSMFPTRLLAKGKRKMSETRIYYVLFDNSLVGRITVDDKDTTIMSILKYHESIRFIFHTILVDLFTKTPSASIFGLWSF